MTQQEVERGRRPAAAARGPRSLAPKEHGAYGQLALPLTSALLMGRPTLPALGMTAATVAVFLAHEPILVLLGQRGSRALREDGSRARARVAVFGAVAALAGGAGLLFAPRAAQLAAIVPAALSIVLAPFVMRGDEKTASGELLAAATLAGAAVPVAIAAGAAPAAAWGAWAAWCLVFGASTLAVRSVIAHARAPLGWPRRLAAPLAAAVTTGLLAASGVLGAAAAIGAMPMLALATALAARPPGPRSLKRVGWGLVASSLALMIALGVGAHA